MATTFPYKLTTGEPGPGPLRDAGVSRTPSPQGQECERESRGGDSEAGPANTPAGRLITLSTLLLSGLLFQQHYSLTGPCLPGNYTAELVLPEGGTDGTQTQHSTHKMWIDRIKKTNTFYAKPQSKPKCFQALNGRFSVNRRHKIQKWGPQPVWR